MSFDRQFKKAVDTVFSREKERARVLKAAGFQTYREAKNEADELMLSELASDCHNAGSAYVNLSLLCRDMANSLARESKELDRAADSMR